MSQNMLLLSRVLGTAASESRRSARPAKIARHSRENRGYGESVAGDARALAPSRNVVGHTASVKCTSAELDLLPRRDGR